MSTPIYPMTNVAPTIAAILDIPVPAQSTGEPLEEVVGDLSGCERVAVLVPDALGMHPWGLWKEKLPYLTSLMKRQHVILRSVMPTITPVNFATMVTGGDQSVHGIHTKSDDFQCDTIFESLEAAGMRGAAIGQDGCSMADLIARWAQIKMIAPRYDDDTIVEMLLETAADETPDFIITQLVTTDDIFHKFMPSSPEVVPYLIDTDARLNCLAESLVEMDYGIIILADHGQHDSDGRGTHGTDADEDALVPCTWLK